MKQWGVQNKQTNKISKIGKPLIGAKINVPL